jgi:Tol biopolymer transport system component
MRASALLLLSALLAGCGARSDLEGSVSGAGTGAGSCAPELVFDVLDDGVNLFVMRADGSHRRALKLPDPLARYAAFTPDGASLLYIRFAPDGVDSSVVVYDLATGATRTVATGSTLSYPSVSPDGQTIGYTANLDVRLVDFDGSNDRLLLQGPFDAGCCEWGYGHPSFTPDSKTVLYGTAGIVGAIGADGTNNRTLISEDFAVIWYPNPGLSPDAQRLAAVVSCDDDVSDLRVYPFASLPAACETGTVLTPADASEGGEQGNNPAWGSMGLIAFAQDSDVFVVDEAGGTPTNLTASLTAGTQTLACNPVWSPACAVLP